MEFNRPITQAEHKQADQKYAEVIAAQKKHILEMAEKISAGQSLDELDTMRVVTILKGYAKHMNTARPRPAGRPSKLPSELAQLVGFRVLEGESKNEAIKRFAEVYDATETSVKNELKSQNFKEVLADMKTWVRK